MKQSGRLVVGSCGAEGEGPGGFELHPNIEEIREF